MVELNGVNFLDFNEQKMTMLVEDMFPTYFYVPDLQESILQRQRREQLKDTEDFFDPQEPIEADEFLDAIDCECTHYDPFDILAICKTNVEIDCTFFESEEELHATIRDDPAVNGPTVSAIAGKTHLELIASEPSVFMALGEQRFPSIMDTGASLAISGNKSDFVGKMQRVAEGLCLGGMANGMPIEGVGDVIWTFDDVQGNEISIKTKAYYVPKAKSRLLSPQRIFNKKRGVSGCFSGDEEKFSVKFNDLPALEMKYDARNSLPIGYARNGGATESPQVNLSIVNDENQNLTQGQKLLLSWHARFGHMVLS
jgi:hypothetical protein